MENQNKKIEAASEKIDHIDDIKSQHASNMVYATDLALSKAPQSRPVEVAKEFNDRAQIILGSPSINDANEMRTIVLNLLSDIEKEKIKGKKALEDVDAELTKLESQKASLQMDLLNLKDKLESINQKNAELANKEKEREAQWWNPLYDFSHGIKKFFVWLIVIAILIIGLVVSSVFFPFLAPVVAVIGQLIGAIVGWIIKHLPGAISGAGVVAKTTYDTAKSALGKIVVSVEDMKKSGSDMTQLMNTLGIKMDSSDKDFISTIKKEFGIK